MIELSNRPADTPDANSLGFLSHPPDPVRYENASRDPDDVGMKLASLIAEGSRVLDVGCGTGSITEIIRETTNARIVGVEPDATRCAMAQKRGINAFEGYLSQEFLRLHGPFDAIVFADVLEHLPNPGELLQLTKNGLAANGAIVASVPNIAHWFVRLDLLRGRFNYRDCGIMDATHLRWFTRNSLQTFLENLGFQITHHLYTANTLMNEYSELRPWSWLPQTVKKRLVRVLVKSFPSLFGCQHVVRAVLK